MSFSYLYYILISFSVSLILTPLGFNLLRRFKVLDKPNSRKIHKGDILTGGGIIIFTTFLIVLIFDFTSGLFLLDISFDSALGGDPAPFQYSYFFSDTNFIGPFLIGFILLFLMGIFDDKFNLNSKAKFLIQIISCSIFILVSGYHISFSFLFNDMPTLSFFLTLLFMLSIINAFNLIDGLDGLASGISLISLVSILLVLDHLSANYVICVLIGSLCAFLIKNIRPAKIFLGDSGSYILGYSISVFIVLISNQNEFENWNLTYLLILIGIPAIDIIYAFLRRLFSGKNIFAPDKKHIHHIVLDRGLSYTDTVLVLYSIQAILCILGLALIGLKVNISIIFFMLPISYLLGKYLLPNISNFYFKINNQKNRKRFSDISVFILVFLLFFFIIKMVNNSSLMIYDYSINPIFFYGIPISQYIFMFIFSISLILSVISIFNNQNSDYSILFFASIIALDFNALSEQWVDIISFYMWYLMIAIIIIGLIFRKINNKGSYIFNPIDYIFFIFLMILSFSSELDLIDFQYLGKIFLILIAYKIILSNSIIKKYRLAHAINITSLLFMIFRLII